MTPRETLIAMRPVLGVRWRAFQQRALSELQAAIDEGDRRVQLVAPPGAGKTLMGLELALQLGRPIVCLSNTQAIAAQWVERLCEFGSFPAGGPPIDTCAALAWPGQRDELPTLTSLTYQAFSLQRPVDERREATTVQARLGDAVWQRQQRVGEERVTLVLDECHHLRRWWADVLVDFLSRFPRTQVIGLTATPPEDASAEERRRFTRIVTDVTHEIPLVAAIREELLAPFSDLVRFVRLTDAEERFVAGAEASIDGVLRELRRSVGEGDDWLPGLDQHVRHRCIEPGRHDKRHESFVALLDDEPDFGIALARWLHWIGDDLPADVYPMAQMWFGPERSDVIALLEDYALFVLRDDERPAAKARWRALKDALGAVGLRLQRNGIRSAGGELDEAVGRSRAKLTAALGILRHELAELGDDLCAAVVTDFERTAVGGRRAEALEHGAVAGAIGAFRAIVADSSLTALRAILATGGTRWMPAELVALLRDRLGEDAAGLQVDAVPAEILVAHEAYVSVSLPGGRGRLLRAMTGLLERDHCHCIVGTRGLLGEGWDCRTLNTLVDLTATRAHVAVNQLRGRALRLDPERPEKVAHIWDVVALANAATTFAGHPDAERFVAKHGRFFAPAADGRLERGPGHVHDELRLPTPRWDDAERIGQQLWHASCDRGAVRARWKIGEALGGREVERLSIGNLDAPDLQGSGEVPGARSVRRCTVRVAAPDVHRRLLGSLRKARNAALPMSVAAVAGGALLVVATGPLAIVGGALLGVSGAAAIAHGVQVWRWGKLGNDATSAQQASRLVAALVQVQAHAARRFRDVDVHVQVDAQTVTMQLSGGTEATRRRLRLALDQLLGGCPTPHYALELVGAREGPGDAPWRRLVAREAVEEVVLGHVPVPTALGTSRKLALAWREAFHQHVASARLVAVRRDAATGQVPFVGGEALAWAEFGGGAVSHRALLE